MVIAPERHRERQEPPHDHEEPHRSSVGECAVLKVATALSARA
jgi:hypothetical protein